MQKCKSGFSHWGRHCPNTLECWKLINEQIKRDAKKWCWTCTGDLYHLHATHLWLCNCSWIFSTYRCYIISLFTLRVKAPDWQQKPPVWDEQKTNKNAWVDSFFFIISRGFFLEKASIESSFAFRFFCPKMFKRNCNTEFSCHENRTNASLKSHVQCCNLILVLQQQSFRAESDGWK